MDSPINILVSNVVLLYSYIKDCNQLSASQHWMSLDKCIIYYHSASHVLHNFTLINLVVVFLCCSR